MNKIIFVRKLQKEYTSLKLPQFSRFFATVVKFYLMWVRCYSSTNRNMEQD